MIVKTSQNIIARIKSITVVIDKLLTPSDFTIKYLNLVLSYCKRFSVTFLFLSLFLLTPSSTSALELSSFSLTNIISSIPNLRVTDTIHNLSKANSNLFNKATGNSWINNNTTIFSPVTNRGEVLGVSTTTSSLAANTITNSFINTFPSNIFCKLGFLIENVDTSYCDTVTDTNTTTTVVNTTDVPTTPTASTTTSVSVNNLDSNPQLETKNLKLETSPIYITQYVNKYITVPGPQGPAGPQGLPGKDAIYIPAPVTYQTPSNNYISYFPPTPSVSLVKVSTVDYLRDTTIEYPKITNGTADNLSLSSATVRNSVFSGANTFNDSANFTGSVSVNSLTATNSVLTSASSTNLHVTNLTVDDSILTRATSTDFFSTNSILINSIFTNATTTNATSTNQYVTNLVTVNSQLTNATSTNHFVTNLSATNSILTNSTSTLFAAVTASTTNLTATNATSTNLFADNSQFTNATSSTLYANSLNAVSATSSNFFSTNSFFTNATSTNLYATNSIFIDSIFTSATSTNWFSTNSTSINATSTNFFVSNLSSTNSILTNSTSTNLHVTNLTADDSQFTNATTTNATSTNLFATNSTFTNSTITNASTTNLTVASTTYFGNNTGVWNENGKVGIGTTAPSTLLHLKSSLPYITFEDTDSATGVLATITGNQDGNMYYSANSNSSATLGGHIFRGGVGGSNLMSISSSGNVSAVGTLSVSGTSTSSIAGSLGIGTTTPVSILHIKNSTSTYSSSLSDYQALSSLIVQPLGGVSGQALITGSISPNYLYMQGGYVGSASVAPIALNPFGGNVGIGSTAFTTSAGYTSLSINNATNSGYVVLQNNGTNKSDWYVSGGTVATLRGVAVPLLLSATGANYLSLETNGVGRVMVDSTGNVGIGTTNPGNQLEVFKQLGGGTLRLSQQTNASGVVIGNIEFYNYSTPIPQVGATISVTRSATDYYGNNILFSTSNSTSGSLAEAMRISQTGNVGIGLTAPSAKLEIFTGNGTSGLKTSLICSNATTNKLYTDGSGNIVCGTDQTGGGSGNLVDTLAATLGSGNDAGGTNMVNLGSVGIGTTNPGVPLHISSGATSNQLRLEGTGTYNAWMEYRPSAGGTENWKTGVNSAGFNIMNDTDSATRLTIDNTGNVGIGITNPTGKLEVSGVIDALRLSGTVGQQLRFMTNSADAAARSFVFATNQSAMGDFVLRQSTTNVGDPIAQVTTRFSITPSGDLSLNQSSGNVGIGTTTPGSILHIYKSSGDALTKIESGNNGSTPAVMFLGKTTGGVSQQWYTGFNISNGNGGWEVFDNTRGASVMYANTSGNVGIGTTTPAYKLEVNGGDISINGASGGVLRFYSGATQLGYLQGNISNGLIMEATQSKPIWFKTNAGVQMAIDGTGNVGIGTTTPSAKLDIWGNLNVGTSSTPTLFVNTATGNVGIGMTAPAVSLDVNGSIMVRGGNSIYLRNTAGDNNGLIYNSGLTGNSKITLQTNSIDRFVVDQQGNIGIGTTNPLSQMMLQGTGQTTAALTEAGGRGGTLMLIDGGGAAGNGGAVTFGALQVINNSSLGFAAIKGLQTNGAAYSIGDLAFSTRNATADTSLTERMRITATGNVGIGTTNPANKLDIYGSGTSDNMVLISTGANVAGGKAGVIFGTQNSANFQKGGIYYSIDENSANRGSINFALSNQGNNSNVQADWAGQTRMTINYLGNVGIGTTNPQVGLDARVARTRFGSTAWQSTDFNYSTTDGVTIIGQEPTINQGNLNIYSTSNAADSGAAIQLGAAETASGAFVPSAKIKSGWTSSGAIGYLSFYTLFGSETERMRIDGYGNVGIGTTNPVVKLDVRGVITSSFSAATYATFDGNTGGDLVITGNAGAANVTTNLIFKSSGSGGAAVSEKMRIDSTGNVGIGTTGPSYPLDVSGNARIKGAGNSLYFDTVGGDSYNYITTANSYDLTLFAGRGSTAKIGLTANNGLLFDTSSVERMRITTTGNVGIGTTAPENPLHVFANDTNVAGMLQIQQSGTGNATIRYRATGATSWYEGLIHSDSSDNFVFNSNTTANVLVLAKAGNVGIGTTNPGRELQIEKNAASSGVTLNNTSAAGRKYSIFSSGTGASVTGALAFYDDTASAYRMVVDSVGNVGIGTTTPRGRVESVASNNSATNNSVTYTGGGMGNPGWAYQFSQTLGSGGGGATYKGGDAGGIFIGGTGEYVAGGGVGVYAKGGGTGNYGYGGTGIYAEGGLNGSNVGGIAPAGVFMGNVGIGTTNPSVAGGLSISNAFGGINLRNAANNDGSSLNWDGTTLSVANVGSSGNVIDLRSGNNIRLSTMLTWGEGVVERMRITNNGNVLVGTTNSDVGGSVAGIRLSSDGSIINSIDGASLAGYQSPIAVDRRNVAGDGLMYGMWRQGQFQGGMGATSGSAVTFITGTNANQYERMRINSGGNVGIGTTNPTAKLQVNGTGDSRAIIYETGTTPYTATLELASQSIGTYGALVQYTSQAEALTISNYGRSSAASSQGDIYFRTKVSNTTPTDVVTIDGYTGYFGIGNTSPGYPLTVNGQPAANGYTAFTNYSDARLKNNVTNLIADNTSALDKIALLRTVTFNYNSLTGYTPETQARRTSGFIAQELRQVFPEMVGTTTLNGTEYFDTNLSDLPLYLVNGVQELNLRTNSLMATASSTLEDIQSLASTTVSTSTPNSFVSRFFSNLFTRITTWLADAGNGIGNVFAKVFKASEKICVDDQCLTKDDVKVLLDLVKAQQSSSIPNSSIPSSTPTPEPIVAGTSTQATSTDPVTPTVDPVASSTDPVTPPADPVIPPVVDPVVPPVDPAVVDPAI